MIADTTDSREPRTAAGKELLDHFGPRPLPEAQELHRRSAQGRRDKLHVAILAIEEQAAAEARRELLAKVEGLREEDPAGVHGSAWAAVLRLIEEQS